MEQDKIRKRKDRVKNAMIVFLTIMLILTFFSNTIMNYSLPEVATQSITSGKITSKVRGSGTVSVSEPYNVSISESRTISKTLVKVGDKVEKDDILFELEDSESNELKEAQDTLDQLITDYEKAVLSGDISANSVNNIQKGTDSKLSDKQGKVEAAKAEVEALKARVDTLTAEVNDLQKQIDLSGNETVDTSAEREALQKAQNTLTKSKKKLAELESKKSTAQAQFDRFGLTISEVENYDAQLQSAKTEMETATEETYEEKKAAYDALASKASSVGAAKEALKALDKAIAKYDEQNLKVTQNELDVTSAEQKLSNKENDTSGQNGINDIKNELIEKNAQLTQANLDLTNAQTKQEDVLKEVMAEIDVGSQNQKIKSQAQTVDKLKEKSVDAKVKAPVSGTVTQVNYASGEKTVADETMAVIQVDGKAYSLTVSVTPEQAKKVKIGDKAQIQDSWNYDENVEVRLAQIKPDPEEKKNKLLVFEVSGEVAEGSQMDISVGENSKSYELIVPTSAIREDKNGKFVLIVESKSSPLGNRYIAKRADVEVLASDDVNSAISGALYGSEYVITTATKPVEENKQVRLTN